MIVIPTNEEMTVYLLLAGWRYVKPEDDVRWWYKDENGLRYSTQRAYNIEISGNIIYEC